MPRKKTADIRQILLKRLQEPETAKEIVDLILKFPQDPAKVKQGDLLTLIKFAMEGQPEKKEAAIPDPAEDFSAYTDAELWDWLKRLEGGTARAP